MFDVRSINASQIEELFNEMEAEGIATLDAEGIPSRHQRIQRTLDMRYRGQGFELNIETVKPFTSNSVKEAIAGFLRKHTEIYGYAEENEPVEIVNAKLRVIGLLDSPQLKKKELTGESKPRETRIVYYETDGGWRETGVYDRTNLGSEIVGPVVIEQYDSTTVVYPGWSCKPDMFGNLILRRGF